MPQRKKVLVGKDNVAEFRCPRCGETQRIDIRGRMRSSTPVRHRIRCSCGASHAVYLERRTFVRKEVALRGSFRSLGSSDELPMTVRNLSRNGLLFELDEPRAAIVPGARLEVDFSFGNQLVTHILKEVSVRRVDGLLIGAEFTLGGRGAPLDPRYDLALAQYDPATIAS